MNTRLRELARCAGYDPCWNTQADRIANFDKEKFAELIITEVLAVIEATGPGVEGMSGPVALLQVRRNIIDYFDEYNF